ncbi:MAG: paraquat-inducible protein A [Campylobacterota bacterium]|nr:paraquat-inducible protein A [Campylobacterota bacterium]
MNYKSACKECGVIVEYDKNDINHNYYCPRCKGLIYAPGEKFSYIIVMALAAFIAYIPTLFLPVLTLDLGGQVQASTLLDIVGSFYDDGNMIIGALILFTGILIPLIMLGLLLLILVPLHFNLKITYMNRLYHAYRAIRHWAMAEVYMISILVAVIKLKTVGHLNIDAGFFIFIFFLICFYITIIWFNPDDIWHNDALRN